MPPIEPGAKPTDKHNLILDAAISVFAEKGFHRSRISDIAERAGVADGTIYLYFRNKDELLLTIFEEKMEELIQGLKQALAPVSNPLEQIHTFARYHFLQVRDNRALAEVLQIELRLSHKFLKEYRPEKLWEYLGIYGSIIRAGQEQGLLRMDLDPYISSWAFFGSLDELAIQWVLAKKNRFTLEAAAEAVASVFIRGMVTDAGAAALPTAVPTLEEQ